MDIWIWLPLACLLTVAVVTDLRSRMIFDWMTVPGLVYFISVHLLFRDLNGFQVLAGVAGLGGISLLMAVVSKGRFGGGDIKLFAMIGAGLGWTVGIWVFLLTFLLAAFVTWPALLIRKFATNKNTWAKEVPLAPFIAASTLIILLMGSG